MEAKKPDAGVGICLELDQTKSIQNIVRVTNYYCVLEMLFIELYH